MTIAPERPALTVLTMALQGSMFAIEAVYVREILDLVPITEVPGAELAVHGLINVRGRVVPLADLRLRFGMPPAAATIDTRIVVIDVEIDGDVTTVGIRADKVYEVTELPGSALEETPRLGLLWQPDFIQCFGKRGDDFIAVLDIGRMLSRPDAVSAADRPAAAALAVAAV